MTVGCTAADLVTAIRAAAATVAEHRVELIQLDRAIGDGDHGENLDRGFKAVLAALGQSTVDDPSAVLKLVATTLISKVGGAAGPLYGTAFLRASTAVKDRAELTAADVAEALTAALGGVVARGKAEPGDKTMVDALTPAVQAATGESITEVLTAAAEAAQAGADATVPLVARKGRASYLGERSAGHMDPGARSTALLLRAFAEAAAR
ncbi:dihydroxyacetone kinase DhaL subunit [Herbihabitans rhizosphaerae]|uniref:Dihydroxyacetone kinase DhaL subunit n=1 Tax=Herbihabitans rhizosphaerae TaxID=1872711 RepID=A0A4Q7KQJ6_9PSEU|nr:dihydroxyacetone kinase DhaL subunit [Herbihabitans rhizosphaerae]